jgi:peptide/nickel transport system ATP-binding protein
VTIQAQILDLIVKLKEDTLSALLFITHDMGLVAEVCDRVGVMYAGTLCESATVKELFEKPAHPYTQALLNSVPKLTSKGELTTIAGSVPNLVTPPSGCRFHPRCQKAMEVCKMERPRNITISDTHQAACHFLEKSV